MKKFFITLGIVFLLLIIFAMAYVCHSAVEGHKLDVSSKAYLDKSVMAIVPAWSVDELESRASDGFKNTTSRQELDSGFSKLKGLGLFQSYEGSEGESETYLNCITMKQTIWADYVAKADFQNGSVSMKIELASQMDNGKLNISTWIHRFF